MADRGVNPRHREGDRFKFYEQGFTMGWPSLVRPRGQTGCRQTFIYRRIDQDVDNGPMTASVQVMNGASRHEVYILPPPLMQQDLIPRGTPGQRTVFGGGIVVPRFQTTYSGVAPIDLQPTVKTAQPWNRVGRRGILTE